MNKYTVIALFLIIILASTGCSTVKETNGVSKDYQNESGTNNDDSSVLSNDSNEIEGKANKNNNNDNNDTNTKQETEAPVISECKISQDYTNKADKKLTVDISYPVIENEENNDGYKKINKSLFEFSQLFLENINVFVEEFETDSNDYYEELSYELTYEIKMQSRKYISISFVMYSSLGGPHPDLQPFSKTYDLLSGEEITLDKIFNISENEYKELIMDYVMKQVKEKFKDDESFLDMIDSKYIMQSIKPGSFYISDNNLVIYFYSYDFLCYAAGNQEFMIPFSDLGDKLAIDFSE